MAALLNWFKQLGTSIVDGFGACCGKTKEDPTTTTVEISRDPDGEVNISQISSGGGGSTHADLLATSMISSGGGGSTHDTNL
ncbi:hypothetical protein HanXRQr2_Chr11g0466951 [Helianthus annuus]|uniref:Uncharacterized protein n=1 Tax=Helianthus annuus TaxID=4232 RepID=A0A251T611_HELAN|nr:hypothetical protein HanXRQr2_Chr11g0466951 [Helianthus annuus]KAJ0873274.1 hypothetical protein HanPSC8_Chr11g0450761 [Helianthus annuus]